MEVVAVSLFSRAFAGLNLSPFERAVLRFLQGLAAAALVAALPIVANALSARSPDWHTIAQEALAAAGTAVLLALHKYVTAQSDTPLETSASITEAGVAAVQSSAAPVAALTPASATTVPQNDI